MCSCVYAHALVACMYAHNILFVCIYAHALLVCTTCPLAHFHLTRLNEYTKRLALGCIYLQITLRKHSQDCVYLDDSTTVKLRQVLPTLFFISLFNTPTSARHLAADSPLTVATEFRQRGRNFYFRRHVLTDSETRPAFCQWTEESYLPGDYGQPRYKAAHSESFRLRGVYVRCSHSPSPSGRTADTRKSLFLIHTF